MKVLIIGGTGFIGNQLCKTLLARGHSLSVLSRRGHGAVEGVSYLAGNAVTGQGLEKAVQTHDAVVYLVGIIREQKGQTFQMAHVDGVRNTLQAMKATGVKRILQMSALGAGLGSGSRYFESKAQAEGLVKQSGLDWTIFRPSLVFGPGDDFFGGVLKGLVRAPAPFIPQIGNGSFPFRPVWVGDVAQAFAQALENPSTIGQSYDVVGPKEYSFRELLLLMRKELRSAKPLLPIPLAIMDVVVPVLNLLPFSPITLDQYRMLKAGNTADASGIVSSFRLEWRKLEDELPQILHSNQLVGG